jgi:hypothetical protein
MGRIGNITAITAATGTLVLGMSGVTLAAESGAHASHAPARSATALTRVVSYLGYHMKVPASWPVYRLGSHSSRCVLFNKHAVYLGSPGTNPRCPVTAVGKTEALLVQPLGSQASLPPQTLVQRGKTIKLPSRRQAAQDAVNQTLRFALPHAGVQVTASYGHDLSLLRSILRGTHLTADPAASHQAAQVGANPDRPGHAARHSSRHHASRQQRPARHHATRDRDRAGHSRHARVRPAMAKPAQSPMDAAAPHTTLTRVVGAGLGFDTCTVPSVGTMKKWLASPFRTVGTYLGGDNWACNYGNFSKSWVSQVAAMGWRFLPLWVGPQAPCTSISGAARINSSRASAQGWSQAVSAVSTAKGFGYGKGSPIYFDMEGYDNLDSSCSSAVLSFLSGWTLGLHKAGYRSGVYSSASSGVADLAKRYGSGYAEPNDIWFAEWDADAVIGNSNLRGGVWPGYRRVHQFNGPNVEKFGGVRVNIDDDYVAGDVAGLSSPSGAYALAQPDALHLNRASSTQAQLAITAPAGKGSGQTVQWQVQEGHGVTITPDRGTAMTTPGRSVTIAIKVKANSTAARRRDDLRVAVSSGGQALSASTLLVSVGADSQATPKRVVLYAADHSSILESEKVARQMALPPGSVTGRFTTAWRDVADGKSIVLAVGDDALNALYQNPCAWSNPYGIRARSTPFISLGGPLDYPPGKIYYENAAGANPAQTAQITDALTKYALTGQVPSPHAMPASPSMSAGDCSGVPYNP